MFIHQVALARRQWRNLSAYESSCHLSATHGGGFILSLFIAERQAGKLWIPILWSLVWPDREPNQSLSSEINCSLRARLRLYLVETNRGRSRALTILSLVWTCLWQTNHHLPKVECVVVCIGLVVNLLCGLLPDWCRWGRVGLATLLWVPEETSI